MIRKKTIILLVSSLFMVTVCQAQQQENDWAQFGRYAEANKTIGKPAKVVFMGNSITDGWPHSNPEFFSENGYTGRGISGQTTCEMLARFRPDVIDLKPQAVVILAGTNDIAQR